jgi:hypothetical protein
MLVHEMNVRLTLVLAVIRYGGVQITLE